MLERLIIMDMKKNPYNYMNLLKANVFNAHLCNIGNNPFEEEIYLTADQLEAIVMHWDSLNYNKTTRWGSK